MMEINHMIEKRLELICNQFIEEEIGSTKLNIMPPKENVPIISRLHYEKSTDTFEICFNECNDYNLKTKEGIDFLEDKKGHLMGIHIRRFSELDIGNIKLDVLTTIENEIKGLSIELNAKRDILNNVIDKRKLMFLDQVVKDDYEKLKREFVT